MQLKIGDVLYFHNSSDDQLWAVTSFDPIRYVPNLTLLYYNDFVNNKVLVVSIGDEAPAPHQAYWLSRCTLIGNVYNTTTDINSIETNKCKCDLYALMNIGCKCGGI